MIFHITAGSAHESASQKYYQRAFAYMYIYALTEKWLLYRATEKAFVALLQQVILEVAILT